MKDVKQIISECQNGTVSELVQVLGVENTVRLIEVFGGSQIYIPKFNNLSREYRDSEIYKDFLSGISYSELRHKYKLSEKTIRAVINAEREKRKAVKK